MERLQKSIQIQNETIKLLMDIRNTEKLIQDLDIAISNLKTKISVYKTTIDNNIDWLITH